MMLSTRSLQRSVPTRSPYRRFAARGTWAALALALVAPAHAATINAASCSQSSVQSAVASAAVGDTVQVPAGSCSWSAGITISGIQLVGAGSSTTGTVITSGKVTMNKHASAHTRLSGIRFTGTDQHVSAGGSSSSKAYIIDNSYFRMDVASRALTLTANGGLLHHNQFVAVTPTSEDVMTIQTSENWSQAQTLGTGDTTGERNIYFEDNTFSGITETMPDGDVGSRVVIRYNTYTDSSIVFHGGAPSDSSPNGGIRQFEVYNNSFVRVSNAIPLNKWIWVRGGTGVIANNSFAKADSPDNSSYTNKSEIRLSLACPSGYPVQYQVGQSSPTPENPPTRPLLIFGNTGAGSADSNFIRVNSSDTAGGSCGSPGSYIQSGRDYKLNNAWGWAPYTYPHPLQSLGGGAGGGGGLPPPGALRVVN
jgi:hypothetical protein